MIRLTSNSAVNRCSINVVAQRNLRQRIFEATTVSLCCLPEGCFAFIVTQKCIGSPERGGHLIVHLRSIDRSERSQRRSETPTPGDVVILSRTNEDAKNRPHFTTSDYIDRRQGRTSERDIIVNPSTFVFVYSRSGLDANDLSLSLGRASNLLLLID